MIKWIRLLSVLVILVSVCLPTVLLADSITIEVYAKGLYGIQDFRVVYITDTRMDLSWMFGIPAVNVMIRAKYGSYPADITSNLTAPSDGYLVYSGNGTSISDTSMDFNTNPGPLYYKAWGQKADGSWITEALTDWKESVYVLLIGLSVLAVALTFVAIKIRFLPVRLAGSVAWLVLGIWLLTGNTPGFEFTKLWVQALAFLFLLMVFVPLLMQIVVETKVKTKDGGEYTTYRRTPADEPKASLSKVRYQNRRKEIREIMNRPKH